MCLLTACFLFLQLRTEHVSGGDRTQQTTETGSYWRWCLRCFLVFIEVVHPIFCCRFVSWDSFCVKYSGERNSGLSQLRDVILTNLAEQLQKNRFGSEEDDHYRYTYFPQEYHHHIFCNSPGQGQNVPSLHLSTAVCWLWLFFCYHNYANKHWDCFVYEYKQFCLSSPFGLFIIKLWW